MNKKWLVRLVFLLIFGLPVAWYLFLQAFGENRFALPMKYHWPQQCTYQPDDAILLVDSAAEARAVNGVARIRAHLTDKPMPYKVLDLKGCPFSYDAYLIDSKGNVRGEYLLEREEVDRVLAEIDIYLLNTSKGYERTDQE